MAEKKKVQPARQKQMNRSARLQSARSTGWVGNYSGKNLIRGYSRWFGVDPLCAVKELRELGVTISREREEQIRKSSSAQSATKTQRKQSQEERSEHEDSDERFAFIAGYTSGGAAYGISWEELDHASKCTEDGEGVERCDFETDEELPF